MAKRALEISVILSLVLLAACQSAPRLSRTPYILADAVADPFKWVVTEQQSNVVDILYVTDRKSEVSKKGVTSYGHSRSKSLAFGSCSVEIGKSVPWQELIEQSTTLRRTVSLPLAVTNIQEQGRFPESPLPIVHSGAGVTDNPEAVLQQDITADALQCEIMGRLHVSPRKEAYVFVHGYNNSFSDAAFVMAEIWHFLGRQGVPIIYTWPAGIGGMRGYTYDRESGEFTNYHFKQFLKILAATPGLEKIHLIAHSRGTDVTATALRELFLEANAAGKDPMEVYKIANLILAAPDMDMEVVTQRIMAERVPLHVGRTTVYVSAYDRALGFADWLFVGVRRLGQLRLTDLSDAMKANMKNVQNLDLINVAAKTDFIGHGYFHTNPSVSADLVLILRDNLDAGAANGRPLTEIAPHFWELYPGYPAEQN